MIIFSDKPELPTIQIGDELIALPLGLTPRKRIFPEVNARVHFQIVNCFQNGRVFSPNLKESIIIGKILEEVFGASLDEILDDEDKLIYPIYPFDGNGLQVVMMDDNEVVFNIPSWWKFLIHPSHWELDIEAPVYLSKNHFEIMKSWKEQTFDEITETPQKLVRFINIMTFLQTDINIIDTICEKIIQTYNYCRCYELVVFIHCYGLQLIFSSTIKNLLYQKGVSIEELHASSHPYRYLNQYIRPDDKNLKRFRDFIPETLIIRTSRVIIIDMLLRRYIIGTMKDRRRVYRKNYEKFHPMYDSKGVYNNQQWVATLKYLDQYTLSSRFFEDYQRLFRLKEMNLDQLRDVLEVMRRHRAPAQIQKPVKEAVRSLKATGWDGMSRKEKRAWLDRKTEILKRKL